MSDQEKMRFHEMFEYQDGRLIWKTRPASHFVNARTHGRCNTLFAGKEAGNINKGYKEVFLDKERVGVHRIVFCMFNGYMPKMIDHIDGNPLNNRIENLRECSSSQNQHNKHRSTNNTSGVKGVQWNKATQKWQANIRVNRKLTHLGSFDSLQDAASARHKAAEKYHGEFVNHG